jgi:hypothetical protein
MTAFTTTTIAESSLTTFYNRDTISDTSLNGNFNAIKNRVNTLITDVSSYAANLTATGTWTANQTFNAHIAFGSTYGISDTFLLIDSDNTGAGANCSLRFERGTHNAGDAQIVWNASATDASTYYSMTTDGTVLSECRGLTPTTSTAFATKGYVDTQVISGGAITKATTAPATTLGALWIDTTVAAGLRFHYADGSIFVPVGPYHQGTAAPTQPTAAAGHTWIDTTSTTRPEWKRYDGTTWQPIQTAYVTPKVSALTDGANIASDWATGNHMTVTFAGNRTLSNPTNAVNGQRVVYAIRQDATGSRTIAFGSKFRFGTDIPSSNVVLSTAAAKTDYIGVIYHSSDDKFDIVAFVRGY